MFHTVASCGKQSREVKRISVNIPGQQTNTEVRNSLVKLEQHYTVCVY